MVRQLRGSSLDNCRAGARLRRTAARTVFTRVGRRALAFIASALGILGIIATAGVSMFPFLMPSDIARRRA